MPYTEKLSTFGELIEVDAFRDSVREGYFIDYDGFGYPVRDDMMDNSICIYPSQIHTTLPEDATHVIWFNK